MLVATYATFLPAASKLKPLILRRPPSELRQLFRGGIEPEQPAAAADVAITAMLPSVSQLTALRLVLPGAQQVLRRAAARIRSRPNTDRSSRGSGRQ